MEGNLNAFHDSSSSHLLAAQVQPQEQVPQGLQSMLVDQSHLLISEYDDRQLQRHVRVENIGKWAFIGVGSCCFNYGLNKFDNTMPSELASVGLNEDMFTKCIDQINDLMKGLFTFARKLRIVAVLLFVMGLVICFATANVKNLHGIGVLMGLVMIVLSLVALLIIYHEKRRAMVRQRYTLNQYCQYLTNEFDKINIQIVWYPQHPPPVVPVRTIHGTTWYRTSERSHIKIYY